MGAGQECKARQAMRIPNNLLFRIVAIGIVIAAPFLTLAFQSLPVAVAAPILLVIILRMRGNVSEGREWALGPWLASLVVVVGFYLNMMWTWQGCMLWVDGAGRWVLADRGYIYVLGPGELQQVVYAGVAALVSGILCYFMQQYAFRRPESLLGADHNRHPLGSK